MALQMARFLRHARNCTSLSSSWESATWGGSNLVRSLSTSIQPDIGTVYSYHCLFYIVVIQGNQRTAFGKVLCGNIVKVARHVVYFALVPCLDV
jgi:hypothetical protein